MDKFQKYRKESMLFKDYNWEEYDEADPRAAGELNDTIFDRTQGYQVLYLINLLMDHWHLNTGTAGEKLERMIKLHLPNGIRSQLEVKEWIWLNWKFY